MSVSMYRLSIPVYLRGIAILDSYLDAAEAYAAEKRVDSRTLLEASLAPNMLPFSGQIQRATDTSKASIARLTGMEVPRFEDNETTIAELRDRLARAAAFFRTIDPAVMDASEGATVTLSFGKMTPTLTGADYILSFVLPNFYFHIATAHGILRNHGLDVGKADYIGSFG